MIAHFVGMKVSAAGNAAAAASAHVQAMDPDPAGKSEEMMGSQHERDSDKAGRVHESVVAHHMELPVVPGMTLAFG